MARTDEMGMDGNEYSKKLDAKFNMVITKWAEMREKELMEELYISKLSRLSLSS